MKAPATTTTSSSSSSFASVVLRKQQQQQGRVLLFWVLGLLIVSVGVVMYGEEVMCMLNQLQLLEPMEQVVAATVVVDQEAILVSNNNNDAAAAAAEGGGCDVFSGKWVWDNSSRPLYKEGDCPFLPPQVTCQAHGRTDLDYMFWRWQPHDCSLPRFDARKMLEALRGKRMMFVGDSLNRGQFESMICLLNTVIQPNASSFHINASLSVFTAKDYNATVEFYWAPFLLESNSDNPYVHKVALADRVVRKGSINKNGIHWKGVDIMVFNTYLWWMTGLKFNILRSGSFEDEVQDIIQVPTEEAYRLAMKSMLRWVQKNMDLNTSRVFFVTMSPSHQKSQDWGAEAGGNCYNQSSMISDANYWGSDCRKSVMQVIEEVFNKSSHQVPITLLNITQLSSYRKDAHTSIYKKQWTKLTKEQLDNPPSYADCVHWCLPGLQDVWNELLFTKLFYPTLIQLPIPHN